MSESPTPRKLFSFFFTNRTSVLVILVVCIATTSFVPGVGALAPIVVGLVALLTGLKSGSGRILGLRPPDSIARTVFLAAAIGIGLQAVFHSLLDPLFERITDTTLDLSNMSAMEGDPVRYLIWLAIGWGIGGFLEELAFRGYLITRVQYLLGENNAGTAVAVLVSVIPFGIAHLYQDWAGVLSTGLMGLAFAGIYLKSGRDLWLTMLVHGFVNSTDITLIFLGYARAFRLL